MTITILAIITMGIFGYYVISVAVAPESRSASGEFLFSPLKAIMFCSVRCVLRAARPVHHLPYSLNPKP